MNEPKIQPLIDEPAESDVVGKHQGDITIDHKRTPLPPKPLPKWSATDHPAETITGGLRAYQEVIDIE